MDTSLHSMITADLHPLQDGDQHSGDLADDGTSHPPQGGYDTAQGPTSQRAGKGAGKTGERKRKVNLPGSAADFRRKEANRLAADRSRSRAQEKRAALVDARQNLEEENKKLVAEIDRLQHISPDTVDASHGATDNATPEGVHTVPAIGVGMGQTGSDAHDSHSRTILAALMSAGHDGFDSDDAWIQGVEDMFNEAEKSGRLGELAALATGRNGPNREGDEAEGDETPSIQDTPAGGPAADETASQVGAPASEQPQDEGIEPADAQPGVEALVSRKIDYKPEDSAARLTSAVAVLLNAEIERILRDDLATTKAAIAGVDRELTRLRELEAEGQLDSETAEGLEYRGPERRSALPDAFVATSPETLRLETTNFVTSSRALEKEIPTLRESLNQIKTEKIEEETRLAETVSEIQELVADSSLVSRSRVGRMLKSLTGIVGDLLHGSHRDASRLSDAPACISFISPALARRRRGRPPKASDGPNTAEVGHTDLPSSRLSDAITAEAVAAATAAVAEADRRATLTSADEEGDSGAGSHLGPTPEQYILSHLQDNPSFSGFYPSNVDIDPALRSLDTPTDAGIEGTPGHSQADTEGAGHDRLSVLSRWKKGGPDACDICSRTQTSVWRKLTFNGEELKVCNACGLYYHKFKVIRPSELWGDGKSLKKRRPTQRRTEAAGDGDARDKKRKRAKYEDVNETGVEAMEAVHSVGDEQHGESAEDGQIQGGQVGEGPHEGDLAQFDQIEDPQMASVLGMEGVIGAT